MKSLANELMAKFNARQRALSCALSHGQITIDGYVVRSEHLERWTPEQLRGRYAVLRGRPPVQLYGATPVSRRARTRQGGGGNGDKSEISSQSGDRHAA